ncbi:hypothetical protein L3X38_024003 [Prunus dulcis]|uniref:Transposase-associated domain-containing protein n=1 Tax=Prunus dulcis TaxID=3755 RepID=A0AAD4W1J2_PRUDU|nr:hypothetical protein L3X38_024003 [Prunus dulcis]
MDNSWVKLDRADEEYKTCLQQFIDDSLLVASHNVMLKCPCKKCYNRSDSSVNDCHVDTEDQTTNVRAEYAEKFYNLLNDANTHLYPGSTKMKKLEFLVKLYQVKCLSGFN